MKKSILILLLVCTCILFADAQKPALAENIQLSIVNNKVKIEYDFKNFSPNKSYQIDLLFRDNNSIYVKPKSLIGDFGNTVIGGKNKSIFWDISADLDIINTGIKPIIIVNGEMKESFMGGPEFAIVSAIVPGLGNYFVKDHHEMFLKPYMKTLMYATFMGLGIKAYTEYEFYYFHRQVGWAPGKNGEPIPLMGKFLHQNHWLFNGDYELFFFTAGVIWFLDVFYTAATGTQNRRIKNKLQNNRQINLGYHNKTFGISFAQKF